MVIFISLVVRAHLIYRIYSEHNLNLYQKSRSKRNHHRITQHFRLNQRLKKIIIHIFRTTKLQTEYAIEGRELNT